MQKDYIHQIYKFFFFTVLYVVDRKHFLSSSLFAFLQTFATLSAIQVIYFIESKRLVSSKFPSCQTLSRCSIIIIIVVVTCSLVPHFFLSFFRNIGNIFFLGRIKLASFFYLFYVFSWNPLDIFYIQFENLEFLRIRFLIHSQIVKFSEILRLFIRFSRRRVRFRSHHLSKSQDERWSLFLSNQLFHLFNNFSVILFLRSREFFSFSLSLSLSLYSGR